MRFRRFQLSVLIVFALSGLTHSQDVPKIAFLEPINGAGNVNEREGSINPLETASRVIPKLAKEGPKNLKWPVAIVDYEAVLAAEHALVGNSPGATKSLRFRQYKALSQQLGARYLVTYTVLEHTGHHTGGGLLTGRRVTGRTSLDLTVYDGDTDQFVWQSNIIDTSTAPGNSGVGGRIDQSMFNALRKALEPFVLKGERKKVATPVISYIATVRQVVSEGKRVLLDLGSDSDIAVGDVLKDLDGKVTVKVTEILKNGSIAEVLEGTATAGSVLKNEPHGSLLKPAR